LKRIQRMPNIPLAYVSVYRRISDIFHTLAYASTIRNSVTGPLERCTGIAGPQVARRPIVAFFSAASD
jgi:hypothetical protein